jgi:catechol 2,3-dioxygenase-like lactoylglutathione lyase family enzyme
MIQVREIDHVVLRVNNLPAMLTFYCEVLGCKIERQQEGLGLIQLRAGRSLIDLVTVDGKLGREGGAGPRSEGRSEGRNMDHLCLRVDPFDAETILAELRESNLNPGEVASRYGAEGEGPSIYVKDPEGNTVELKGPPLAGTLKIGPGLRPTTA